MELKIKALIAIFLVTGLLASTTVFAEVYRWVDENGEIHYSESLPPNFKDDGHDVLNERGIILDEDLSLTPPPPEPEEEEAEEEKLVELPRDSSGLPRPKPLYSESEKQNKLDRLLLLRYASAEDINVQRDFEVDQVASDKKLLETGRDSLLSAYRGQIRQAADRQRSGQQLDETATESIRQLQVRLEHNKNELDSLISRERKVREDFQRQFERYRYLEELWAEDSAGS